jgi:hypothetical protein
MVAADESTLARVNRVVLLVPAARPRPDRLAGRRPSWRGAKVNEGFLWNPMLINGRNREENR